MQTDLQLSAVSETLFLPLYCLALASQQPNPILADPGAVELTRRLNEHFAASDKPIFKRLAQGRLPATLITTMALRIRRFDQYVRDFLQRQPDAVVVNLGCGLDDRRRRVDNGRMRWFDLDLPEVIDLRRQFLPESDRMRFLACSVLDHAWIDELPDDPGSRVLFLAEGLFMYLPKAAVISLVATLRERRPGAELVAEMANSSTVRLMQGRYGRGKFRRNFGLSQDVVYQCGIDNGRELESWAPGMVLLDEWGYFDEDEPRLGWMRWLAWLPRIGRVQWTVHYRLGESVCS